MIYNEKIIEHYQKTWHSEPVELQWNDGPMKEYNEEFEVLEFPPSEKRKMWTYATCGMSDTKSHCIELHIFSSEKNRSLVEILTAIAYYHMTSENKLNLDHTVNFGQPWVSGSKATYGLISLPYLDGPDIETLVLPEKTVKCYWLIPITLAELNFKKKLGIEALEEKFEENEFNYLDPFRDSVVS